MSSQPDILLEKAKENFEKDIEGLGLNKPGTLKPSVPLQDLRRGRRYSSRPTAGTISLFERDGMLFWEISPMNPTVPTGLRRLRRRNFFGRLIAQKEFTALGPNEINQYLSDLDKRLTPERGLREWSPQQKSFIPFLPTQNGSARFLLFIHGTFSHSGHIFDDLLAVQEGVQFLTDATQVYKRILAFDHATVSVSPILNAMDLRDAVGQSTAEIDIICHSRGGLVARWWMEVFDSLPARKKRAVFIASPLNGTSLASPARLRAGLNSLATLGKLLGSAAMAIPLLQAPAAILRVLSSVVGLSSRVPIVDAAIAMIPGLQGQSRITNNQELLRLNKSTQNIGPYFFVRSDFDCSEPGWNFCKYIRDAKIRLADAAVDRLVFPGQNDLVVDTESMTEVPGVGSLSAANLKDFGTNSKVYHTNYFLQGETLAFIRSSLGW